MKVRYRVRLDDPVEARERRFVRDVGEWPFPCLPAPGDVVIIDVPGSAGGLRAHQQGDLTVWEPERAVFIEGRPVNRVVYSAATAEAFIELRADGLSDDAAEQVAVLKQACFQEV